MPAIGHRTWVIAEGHLPAWSAPAEPELSGHETFCVLNTGDRDAHLSVTIFYADRDPAGPYRMTCPARRTLHQRFDDLTEPEPVPRGTDFASLIESDEPVVVQHTRLDSRHAANALLSTIAFPAAGG